MPNLSTRTQGCAGAAGAGVACLPRCSAVFAYETVSSDNSPGNISRLGADRINVGRFGMF